MIAHILYYFSQQNDLVFDPMGGGGVTPDVCLAFNRRCWTVDMIDRPATRPEIEPYYWDLHGEFTKDRETAGFFTAKQKPDIIICDPPTLTRSGMTTIKGAYPRCPGRNTWNSLSTFLHS